MSMKEWRQRNLAIKIAMHWLGLPYIWGGDDPIKGFDCSGYCIEILKSLGKLPRQGDWKAKQLANMFIEVPKPKKGCLVFWANNQSEIIHVEMCLDSELSIGAAGGGSSTINEEKAIAQNAYIRIRPIKSRIGIAKFVDPFFV